MKDNKIKINTLYGCENVKDIYYSSEYQKGIPVCHVGNERWLKQQEMPDASLDCIGLHREQAVRCHRASKRRPDGLSRGESHVL